MNKHEIAAKHVEPAGLSQATDYEQACFKLGFVRGWDLAVDIAAVAIPCSFVLGFLVGFFFT